VLGTVCGKALPGKIVRQTVFFDGVFVNVKGGKDGGLIVFLPKCSVSY
jgi:hypothetical protein